MLILVFVLDVGLSLNFQPILKWNTISGSRFCLRLIKFSDSQARRLVQPLEKMLVCVLALDNEWRPSEHCGTVGSRSFLLKDFPTFLFPIRKKSLENWVLHWKIIGEAFGKGWKSLILPTSEDVCKFSFHRSRKALWAQGKTSTATARPGSLGKAPKFSGDWSFLWKKTVRAVKPKRLVWFGLGFGQCCMLVFVVTQLIGGCVPLDILRPGREALCWGFTIKSTSGRWKKKEKRTKQQAGKHEHSKRCRLLEYVQAKYFWHKPSDKCVSWEARIVWKWVKTRTCTLVEDRSGAF